MSGAQPINVLTGAVLSAALAALAMRAGSLTRSGAVGAVLIGTLIYGFGGWKWYVVLLLFFFSSSLLTKYRCEAKEAKGVVELKGGARNLWQAVGQGGAAVAIATISVIPWAFTSSLATAFVGAIGEANADTWAVELGILSKGNPRLMADLRRKVPPGTSGGITVLGELSAIAGALLIATASTILGLFDGDPVKGFLISFMAAVLGEHVDSVLGATIQASYYCTFCGKPTERRVHSCGNQSVGRKGLSIISNEAVNLLSTSSAAVIAFVLHGLLAF